jgi:hypothetical protein
MKHIYVAGPFRSKFNDEWQRHLNILAAEAVGPAIARAGCLPMIPHTMLRNFQGLAGIEDSFWLEATLSMLKRCDALILLPTWEVSIGSKGEAAQAKVDDLPILDLVRIEDSWRTSAVTAFCIAVRNGDAPPGIWTKTWRP